MTSNLTNAAERAAVQKLAAALGLPAFEPGWVWLAPAPVIPD